MGDEKHVLAQVKRFGYGYAVNQNGGYADLSEELYIAYVSHKYLPLSLIHIPESKRTVTVCLAALENMPLHVKLKNLKFVGNYSSNELWLPLIEQHKDAYSFNKIPTKDMTCLYKMLWEV